jgi:hypothetical protein
VGATHSIGAVLAACAVRHFRARSSVLWHADRVPEDRRTEWQRRYDESVEAEDARLERGTPGPKWAWAISAVPLIGRIGDVAIAVDAWKRRRRREER